MEDKYYVLIYHDEIKAVSTDKTKMEILRDAMRKRLDEYDRDRVELLECEEPNVEYAKNILEQPPLWHVKRSESFNTFELSKLDYREELKFFEKSRKEDEIITSTYSYFEIFIRADNCDQAKKIATEKINRYIWDNNIIQNQLHCVDFYISYSLIYEKKENVPLGQILNDNITFDSVYEVYGDMKQNEKVRYFHDEISGNIRISVFLKANNKQPKEKLIPRAKSLAMEYMYRRIMFDE